MAVPASAKEAIPVRRWGDTRHNSSTRRSGSCMIEVDHSSYVFEREVRILNKNAQKRPFPRVPIVLI